MSAPETQGIERADSHTADMRDLSAGIVAGHTYEDKEDGDDRTMAITEADEPMSIPK